MALVVQPQASVAEKWSSTNRIRSQFARIKAAKRRRYQLWLLRKRHLHGAKNAWKVRVDSQAKVRTRPGHRPGKSSCPPCLRQPRQGHGDVVSIDPATP